MWWRNEPRPPVPGISSPLLMAVPVPSCYFEAVLRHVSFMNISVNSSSSKYPLLRFLISNEEQYGLFIALARYLLNFSILISMSLSLAIKF